MELIDKNDLIKRMKIGAPMDWGHNESEKVRDEQYRDDMLTIQCCQEVPAIPIPTKATNGDMIKAMFPNDSRNFLIVNMGRNDWWNAPYNLQEKE